MIKFDQYATHPFGAAYVNPHRNLGYVRIPKCASTSLMEAIAPTSIQSLDGAINQNIQLLSVIRDPKNRIFSSFYETINRITHVGHRQNDSDIEVNANIFNGILELSKSKSITIPEVMIDIIKEYGFFDAHHLPYKYFLHTNFYSGYADAKVIDLSQVNVWLSKRGMQLPHRNQKKKLNILNRANRFNFQKLKPISQELQPVHYLTLITCASTPRFIINQKLRDLYNQQKCFMVTKKFKNFLEDNYDDDINLHERISY